VAPRGVHSILEGREQAAVRARAVVLGRVRRTDFAGALPLAAGTLVGTTGNLLNVDGGVPAAYPR